MGQGNALLSVERNRDTTASTTSAPGTGTHAVLTARGSRCTNNESPLRGNSLELIRSNYAPTCTAPVTAASCPDVSPCATRQGSSSGSRRCAVGTGPQAGERDSASTSAATAASVPPLESTDSSCGWAVGGSWGGSARTDEKSEVRTVEYDQYGRRRSLRVKAPA